MSDRYLEGDFSLPAIILIVLLMGPLVGLISIYLYAFLTRISGGWIGGQATSEHLRAALAWGSVPGLFTIPLTIFFVVFDSVGLLDFDESGSYSFSMIAIFVGYAFLSITLLFWNMFTICNTVAEVQGFYSAWAGLGNLILSGLIFIVPLLLVVIGAVALFR